MLRPRSVSLCRNAHREWRFLIRDLGALMPRHLVRVFPRCGLADELLRQGQPLGRLGLPVSGRVVFENEEGGAATLPKRRFEPHAIKLRFDIERAKMKSGSRCLRSRFVN